MNRKKNEPYSDAEKGIIDALGEPILPELDDNTLRIRRNLMLVSAISLFIVLHDIQISSGNFGGIILSNLTPESVIQALFFVTFYQFVHFNFNAWDYRRKWRLRATGINHYVQTTMQHALPNVESFAKTSQTTLYAWWLQRSKRISAWEESVAQIQNELSAIQQSAKNEWPLEEHQRVHMLGNIHEALMTAKSMEGQFAEVKDVLDNDHFRVRLKRFDRWFLSHQREQVFRLIVVEWLLPVIMGLVALYLTSPIELVTGSETESVTTYSWSQS